MATLNEEESDSDIAPLIKIVSEELDSLVIVDSVKTQTDSSSEDIQFPHERYDSPTDNSDHEEEGVKGVADIDYLPENDSEITMIRGDIVLIHGQTLDKMNYTVVNLRTSERGEVPVEHITIVYNDDTQSVPTHSNLQRGHVILRKRPKSNSANRATGSLFSDNLTLSLPRIKEPDHTSLEEPSCTATERFAHSESYTQSLPVQYRRLEKFKIVSISGSDKMSRPVIIFSSCRLPPSYQINHDTLLEYLKYTLDQYVENDYTLVYFHYGLTSINKPTLGWLYQIYKELDRKYKKNLKKLYIVHPTTFVKAIMTFFKPIISYKFGRKMVYINRLSELDGVLYTDQMDIPDEVKNYDCTLRVSPRPYLSTESRSSFYVSINESSETNKLAQFGVNLRILQERTGNDIPLVLKDSIEYIDTYCIDVLGIFRRTPSQYSIQDVKRKYNSGNSVDFLEYNDPHLAATTIKMFLRELPEPLLTFPLHSQISNFKRLPEDRRVAKCHDMILSLPDLNYTVTKYLFQFISKVTAHSESNKMTSTNLSIVFGPNLLWSQNEVATLNSMSEINRFTLLLIDHYTEIFTK